MCRSGPPPIGASMRKNEMFAPPCRYPSNLCAVALWGRSPLSTTWAMLSSPVCFMTVLPPCPLRFCRGVYGRTFSAGSEDRRGLRVTNVIAGFGRVTLPNPARVSTAPCRRLFSTLRAFAGPGLSAFQLLPFHCRPAAHEAPLPAAVGFYALAASDDLLKC